MFSATTNCKKKGPRYGEKIMSRSCKEVESKERISRDIQIYLPNIYLFIYLYRGYTFTAFFHSP